MTGVAGGVDPMGDHLVAAHCPCGGFKQTCEVGLGFQWETACDLAGIQSLIGNALVVHDPACSGDGSFDCFLIPTFAVKQQAMGLPQRLAGMDFLIPPKSVRLLCKPAQHRVRVHLPEHSRFAVAAGLGVGQSLSFQQHHVGDATTGQRGCAAEAGHASPHNHDRCLAGQGIAHAHSLSPKLSPMGSWLGVAATSSRAAPTESPWSRWLR